jgi:biotin carboxyl carrier protein
MRYLATLEGAQHELEVEELTANSYLVRLGQRQFEVDLRRVGPASFSVIVDHRAFDLDVAQDGDELIVASRDGLTRVSLLNSARRRFSTGTSVRQVSGRAELKAMMPGRVVDVLVGVGDKVCAEQGVLIVEAMKMENELKAPKPGKVVEVKVAAGQTVEKGDLLVVIE